MKNKIYISTLFLFPGKVGGAENYLYNLLKGFVQLNKQKDCILIVNKSIRIHDIFSAFKQIVVDLKVNRGLYDYLLAYLIPVNKNDLIFSPNYVTSLLVFKKIKRITTIHDVQYLHFPQFFSWKKRLWLLLSHYLTLQFSDRVICISQNVKHDIIKFFGEKYRNKLEVIYNPIDFQRFSDCDSTSTDKINNKFILSVAAHYPHKNLITLVKAFNIFCEKNKEYSLILTGQIAKNLVGGNLDYFHELEEEIFKNKQIILTGYVDDSYLGYLYKNCDLFVFPSIFEGFGMPPIEAMGFGKPVITTTMASLKEVTMGEAIYVDDAFDATELSQKIDTVIENLDHYTKYAQLKSTKIVNRYKPESIANQYFTLFEDVMNEK